MKKYITPVVTLENVQPHNIIALSFVKSEKVTDEQLARDRFWDNIWNDDFDEEN